MVRQPVEPGPDLDHLEVQVDRALGIIEQLLGHPQIAVHIFQDHVGKPLAPFCVDLRVGQQLGETADVRERTFEIVHDRCGHIADGGQPLRFHHSIDQSAVFHSDGCLVGHDFQQALIVLVE